VIEILVLGGTLAVAGWLAGAQTHRRLAASRALERYARSRGLVFVPAPESPKGASPRVLGSKDEVAFVVELFRLGKEVRTRVSAVAQRGRAPTLSVLQRNAFLVEREAASSVDAGTFDLAYVVTTGEAADVEALRETTPLLLHLEKTCQGVWLASDGHKVSLSWRGIASDPLVIDAARDAVTSVARWHRPAEPYR
jgi:hypothetical protein